MEMLLMGLCMTYLGMAVAAVAFGAATRPESSNHRGTARASRWRKRWRRPAFSRTVYLRADPLSSPPGAH